MSSVLVAEKESRTRREIEKILVRQDFVVESVADSRALMEKLERETPDLLFLDIFMPNLDGLRIMKKLGDIPVVILTSEETVLSEIPKAFKQGFTHYLFKPFDSEQLLDSVRRLLASKKPHRRQLEVPLSELHDSETGRIDARKVAEFLSVPLAQLAETFGANYVTVHKTPDAPSLQPALGPIKRAIEIVTQATRAQADARAWLNNPHPDLGGKTPLEVMLSGQADAVVTLLENALAGIPS